MLTAASPALEAGLFFGAYSHSPSHGSNHSSPSSSRSVSNYQIDSKNACSHSKSVASNTKVDANGSRNIPRSELPRNEQMAYGSILDRFNSRKGQNKK